MSFACKFIAILLKKSQEESFLIDFSVSIIYNFHDVI